MTAKTSTGKKPIPAGKKPTAAGKKQMPVAKVKRHGFSVRFVHWSVTLSTFILIFTGIGQMPMYRRYMVERIPGLAWSSDFAVTLNLHYWAAALLLFAAAYHIILNVLRRDFTMLPKKGDLKESYHIIKAILTGGKEPESGKYLAEQRLAYAFIAGSLILLILTGVVKVAKNLPGLSISDTMLNWVTTLHNVGTFLVVIGFVGHMAAFIFKKNRCLLPCMFTGHVELEYARERHGIWYGRLCECGQIRGTESQDVESEGAASKNESDTQDKEGEKVA